ncbi:MAG: hypothetical protein K0S24_1938 [Sphingobacterium sp.]|jgi:hypothetical protein|nr:hypothetical protein [Sphingobacterium sp.]
MMGSRWKLGQKLKGNTVKKIFNKIGQVLQLVLTAPVKLPGKVGNILKYLALGLGIVETVLDREEPPPEADDVTEKGSKEAQERSKADEAE